jgi:nitroimidazol reductase NimA-like FMN-containing flavoprotein (pyridoxamine 5'-phosphate oxidase superfamily)
LHEGEEIRVFHEMRRKNKAMPQEQAVKLLEEGKFGILSLAGENGYAYGVPLNYVSKEGCIYFHCAADGYKLDCIAYNNKVSFCVIGDTKPLPEKFSYEYESVIAFGRAEEVSGQEKLDALKAIIQKYSSGFMDKGLAYIKNDADKTKVIRIDIEHITGKGHV